MCVQQSVFLSNLFLIKSKWLCYLFVRQVKEIWLTLRTEGTQDAVAHSCFWHKKCNLCPGVGRSCGWVLKVKRWGVLKRSCDKGLLMQTVSAGRRGWDFIFASFFACIQILCWKCKCRRKAEFPYSVIRAIHYSAAAAPPEHLRFETRGLWQWCLWKTGRLCLHIYCLHSFNVQLRTTLRNSNISHTCILTEE